MSVSNKYDEIIRLIDVAGGPKLPNMKSLTFSEKMKISFSIWAFLFGIFYYIYIGCWKKGITYLAISILLVIILEALDLPISDMSWIIGPVIFATRAKLDIYKKYKLNDNNWI